VNEEALVHWGAVVPKTNRQTCEIKPRISVERAAFNKKTPFSSKLDINLRNKLVKW